MRSFSGHTGGILGLTLLDEGSFMSSSEDSSLVTWNLKVAYECNNKIGCEERIKRI